MGSTSGVLLRQSSGIREAGRFADEFKAAILAEGIPQAVADEGNGEMGDVDSDPAPIKLLGSSNGRAAPAERV